MQKYDTLIIGAGHNGLVCAAYLAKAGQKVLVLEASDNVGGLARSREFHPGFKASVAQSVNQFSAKIAKDLNLASHGYKLGAAIPTVGLAEDGNNVSVLGDAVTGASASDAANYKGYRKLLLKYMDVLKPYSLKTMPKIGNNSLSEMMTFAGMGLKMRMLGADDMGEMLRVLTLPSRDLMDENFESDILKAVLSWDGLVGSRMAPRSPNNTVLTMLYRMSGEHGGDHALPEGGIEGLVNALTAAAKAAGAEIKTGAAVKSILTDSNEDGLFATGVELENGEAIEAARVVSTADPKCTFVDMVGVDNLEIDFSNRINRLRSDGLVAKLHLALSAAPDFKGVGSLKSRMIIAPEMDAIEFAYDPTKYHECTENPVMEIMVPSAADASCAPEGQHVLSANVMYVPKELKGGWTDAARKKLLDDVMATIEKYAPGIKDQVLHAELLTPQDIADDYNNFGGHWHHTEFALDQMMMMRPTYGAAQYSTPLPGLWIAGAGSHPGGGLMGGPGHNAAQEILK